MIQGLAEHIFSQAQMQYFIYHITLRFHFIHSICTKTPFLTISKHDIVKDTLHKVMRCILDHVGN